MSEKRPGEEPEGEDEPAEAGAEAEQAPVIAREPRQGPYGKNRGKGAMLAIFRGVEQLLLKYGTQGAVLRYAPQHKEILLANGGKPVPPGTLKRYVAKVYESWQKDFDEAKDKRRAQHRAMVMRRMALAEQDGAWGAVFTGHRLLMDLEGLAAPTKLEGKVDLALGGQVQIDIESMPDEEIEQKAREILAKRGGGG